MNSTRSDPHARRRSLLIGASAGIVWLGGARGRRRPDGVVRQRVVNRYVYRRPGFHPVRDFTPITTTVAGAAEVALTHVPYRGASAAVADIIA
jgi:hypothetical protein